MRIGIEINGVLRNTLDKFEKTYQKFMIDKTDGMEEEESFDYKITLPITSLDLKSHFTFQNDDEYFSFLYEEFPMEIFGHAQSTEYSTFNDLNELYVQLRDNHDILIVSDEIGKSKPASLFYSNQTINSMWDEIDVLLTSNPDLILNHPDNKHIIKYNTDYNKEIKCDDEISSIKELSNKLNQIINNNVKNI